MYEALLDAISLEMAKFGASLQPPATAAELDSLRAQTQRELAGEIPKDYLDFLSLINGMDWSGLVVFACQRSLIVGYSDRVIEGFVEANLNHRDFEPFRDYLIFAHDGTVLYTYNLLNHKYEVLTTITLTVLTSYDSFAELIRDAFAAVS